MWSANEPKCRTTRQRVTRQLKVFNQFLADGKDKGVAGGASRSSKKSRGRPKADNLKEDELIVRDKRLRLTKQAGHSQAAAVPERQAEEFWRVLHGKE